ncbi:hypothetical protein MKW92_032592 [Papaver armeniacum]|nr:hypothetical protein MKW92_032592 [Papaver armeniacum]
MERQLMSSCAMDSCFFNDILDHTHGSNHTNSTSNQTEQGMSELPHSQNYINFGTKNLRRESVRKYRERKKARQASIEDELNRMRIVNQQLLKRMQGLCLLLDIRGRIKGEVRSFPYKTPTNGIGVIPQHMPRPSASAGACEVNHCDHQCPGLDNNSGFKASLEFGQANVRLKTNFSTSTAAKKQKERASKCLNHV